MYTKQTFSMYRYFFWKVLISAFSNRPVIVPYGSGSSWNATTVLLHSKHPSISSRVLCICAQPQISENTSLFTHVKGLIFLNKLFFKCTIVYILMFKIQFYCHHLCFFTCDIIYYRSAIKKLEKLYSSKLQNRIVH